MAEQPYRLLLLNGPNLNLLGTREPTVYGQQTLAQIEQALTEQARAAGAELSTLQSNAEHELVDAVQAAAGSGVDFILINPGAFTHTSIALRDAFLGVGVPLIEVHLSNIHQREEFRHRSYFSDIAEGVIVGLGAQGYQLALSAALSILQNREG
ncbi:MAG TPA: type II 3-dehydroquinate dehydratase [Gammaproteobacteria bacterium]|jgi:3-dehydroquinate dehydratase-2|nr:type II 3-dehydroquinate dehydratase [Gammaproteobacteria bacterium]MAI16496.1 type II 3-dehydroquinate dehydratase [Gammaproteobacteria bacterium]HBF62599.1 type II 3-dehydroquinate dehydratase [Gammaproteobacteria bacterium]HBK11614.1 type II 3-dehydroquinate dehydratase [Gammaproteobacteria bacterium]|tara:strand:- start:1034 stop:1495 length:462 start_codon:yes stop_codon:yes gene_type:complete